MTPSVKNILVGSLWATATLGFGAPASQTVTAHGDDAKALFESLQSPIVQGIKKKYITKTKSIGPLKCYQLIDSTDNRKVYYRCAFRGTT